MAIAKTLDEVNITKSYSDLYLIIFFFQVTWSGPNIVVFNDVTITPPYKVENVTGNPDSRQYTYVRKIVSMQQSKKKPITNANIYNAQVERHTTDQAAAVKSSPN